MFLELPGMFKNIIEYDENLGKESYVITNIMQAEFWIKNFSKTVVDGILLPT